MTSTTTIRRELKPELKRSFAVEYARSGVIADAAVAIGVDHREANRLFADRIVQAALASGDPAEFDYTAIEEPPRKPAVKPSDPPITPELREAFARAYRLRTAVSDAAADIGVSRKLGWKLLRDGTVQDALQVRDWSGFDWSAREPEVSGRHGSMAEGPVADPVETIVAAYRERNTIAVEELAARTGLSTEEVWRIVQHEDVRRRIAEATE